MASWIEAAPPWEQMDRLEAAVKRHAERGDRLGTNYYYLDGKHIAKISNVGPRGYTVYWAIEPSDIEDRDDNEIMDEYGRRLPLVDFLERVADAYYDTSTVGQEFS